MSRAKKKPRKRKPTPKSESNKQQLIKAFKWFREDMNFDDLTLHGNTTWKPWDFVLLALLWIWSGKKSVTDAFDDASVQSRQLIRRIAVTTYQGLAKALVTQKPQLLPMIQRRIHKCMETVGGKKFRVGLWVAFAMDGSRTTAPRTRSNEDAFCAKNFGKGKTAKYRKSLKGKKRKKKHRKNESKLTPPQIWVTLIWHIGLGIPWLWKLGPSTASERNHIKDIVASGSFPQNTLFVGDAGFVGYELWTAILASGQHFMVRAGANVRLLKDLGCHTKHEGNIVDCWPNKAMQKSHPPLTLRLVECKAGKARVSLLTSVLDENALTEKEMSRLYEQRWGIELEFRSLKQIFERRTLRCRNSDRAMVELDWSIVGMAIIELFTLKEQMSRTRGRADPSRMSFAKSLRAFRKCLAYLTDSSRRNFLERLANAVVDDYERSSSKQARYRCKRKKPPKCGQPIVKKATVEQRRKARKYLLETTS